MNYINVVLNILISLMVIIIGYEDYKKLKITNKNLLILFALTIIYSIYNGFVINSLISFFIFFIAGFIISLLSPQMGAGDFKFLSLMVMYPALIVHKYYFIIFSMILFLIYFMIKRMGPIFIYSLKDTHKISTSLMVAYKCMFQLTLPMGPALSLGYLIYIWFFSLY